jgi:molecular chaperone GrpE
VMKQLADALAKRGVTPIARKGEKFDPSLENAVMRGTPEDGEAGTVCEVLQKGYQMGNFVLRHAMVKVVPD